MAAPKLIRPTDTAAADKRALASGKIAAGQRVAKLPPSPYGRAQ